VEVHIDYVTRIGLALVVSDVLPLTSDAGIPEYLAAIFLAEWCA
jgi:hypothetical protein